MPAYLIRHPAGKQREDVLVQDSNLTLAFRSGWAIFSDASGICLAVPAEQGASIQRVDDKESEPAQPD